MPDISFQASQLRKNSESITDELIFLFFFFGETLVGCDVNANSHIGRDVPRKSPGAQNATPMFRSIIEIFPGWQEFTALAK